jgi:hypothetical protein
MLPESQTGLYWSIRGHVACAHHAAEITASRWSSESWKFLPAISQGRHGQRYQCEYCSPEQTALVHPTPDDSSTASQRR